MPSPGEVAQLMKIIEGWETMQITNYIQMTGHALIVVDYLHTLPDEIRLMWPSGFSLPKVLFFTLRYYVFVHHVLGLYYTELNWATPSQCHSWFLVISTSAGVIVLISELILFVRVYAFSGRNSKMLIYLVIQYLVLHVPAFVLLVVFAKRVVYTTLPIPICMPVESQYKLVGGCFSITFASVLIIMLIMAHLAYNKHKGFNSTLLSVFYRDGVYYFVCLSALAMINSIINFAAPLAYKFMFIQLEVDLHVILATRMLLHLREWSQREQAVIQGDQLTGDINYTGNAYYLTEISSKPSLAPMKFQRRELPDEVILIVRLS